MPFTWPWNRSRPVAGEETPAAAGSSAAPTSADPGWRAVAPIQRTVGAMELTARPRDFASSLATAQDPALITPNRPQLLTTGSPVSVLRIEQHADPVVAQPQPQPSPASHSTRQWMPQLNAQRASLGTQPSPAPSPAPPFMADDAVVPYADDATESTSFVAATAPEPPRIVPVVDHVEPNRPAPAVAAPATRALQRSVESGGTAPRNSSETESPAPPQPALPSVQPIVEPAAATSVVSSIPAVPSAVQRTVADHAATGSGPVTSFSQVTPAAPVSSASTATPETSQPVQAVEFSQPQHAPLSAVAETVLGAPQVVTDTAPPSPHLPQVQTSHEATAANPVVAQPITSSIQRAAADDAPALDTPRAAPVIDPGQHDSVAAHADAEFSRVDAGDPVQSSISLPSSDNSQPRISAAVPSTSQPISNALQRHAISDSNPTATATTGRQVDVPEAPAKVQRFAENPGPATSAPAHQSVIAEPIASEISGSANQSFEPVSFEPRSLEPRSFEPLSGGPVVNTVQRSVGAADAVASTQRVAMPAAVSDPRAAMRSPALGTSVPGGGSPTGFSAPVGIQRSTAHVDPAKGVHETAAAASASASPSAVDDPGEAVSHWTPTVFEPSMDRGNPVIPTAPTLPHPPAGIAAPIAQRSVMPESRGVPESRISNPGPPPSVLTTVQRAATGESDNVPVQFSAAPTLSRAVTAPGTPMTTQRTVGSAEPGRIVLLPPVRTEQPEPPVHAREVLADSARPMSLQRMFGDFAQPMPEPGTRHLSDDSDHSSSQTVTFDSPVAQREMQSAPDPVVQAAAESAPPQHDSPAPGAPPAAAASGHASSPAEVDELVGRLYEPLAARLRAELWLDRERAGALMGLHR